jgi:hypothetical protein
MKYKIKKPQILNLLIFVMAIGISFLAVSNVNAYTSCTQNSNCDTKYVTSNGSPQIMISRNVFSTSSQVNILIHAPDFNSNSYAIDTIGEDGSKVIISTREGSIPYRLVETGFDTGDFAGYVILSSTTSSCSPVCGPTDGYLAASGDDAITVSLVYPDGSTISSTSSSSSGMNHAMIPEFPFADIALIASMITLISFSRLKTYF